MKYRIKISWEATIEAKDKNELVEKALHGMLYDMTPLLVKMDREKDDYNEEYTAVDRAKLYFDVEIKEEIP